MSSLVKRKAIWLNPRVSKTVSYTQALSNKKCLKLFSEPLEYPFSKTASVSGC